MKELLYTVLNLDEWNKDETCDFCPNFNKRNKAVCQIRTRNKVSHRIVDNACACEDCKDKFENDELPKCEKCGELKTRMSFHYNCSENNEKELPVLPHEERASIRYEQQINSLREELTTTEEALEIEREEVVKFQEKSEEWSKKQKQELLDRIKQLEAENEKLKGLTNQALIKEINKLKTQLTQLQQQNGQLVAQIEVKETKKWHWLKIKGN